MTTSGVTFPGRRSHDRSEKGNVLDGNKSGFSNEKMIRKTDLNGDCNVSNLV